MVLDPKMPAIAQSAMRVLAALTIAWSTSCATAPETSVETRVVPVHSKDVLVLERGERLYRVSCSGCHGANADGHGPVAQFLTVPVPDLTSLAARRGGSFPEDEIYKIIDGQANLAVHGPRHMPVWGYEFFGEDPDDEAAHREASEKIMSLLRFLRSIQKQ